ncbi:MAG: hypothetical protein ACRENB_03065 [Gemmatimonadales bacterium]
MRTLLLSAVAALAVLTTAAGPAPTTKVSKPFAGAKVNGGTVTMVMDAGKVTLTLSDDFRTPDTPDPHWQVVDTRGQVFTLERLMIKGDRLNKTITLPRDVKGVAKVVIYCAWAEANLGETTFDK